MINISAIKREEWIGAGVIVLFHLVGLFGFTNDALIPLFKKLVPFHLMLMGIVLFSFHKIWNKQFLIFVLAVYILSFFIEMVGTQTGVIFGHYTYGPTLGTHLFGTPLLIGLNWVMLVYSAGVVLQYFRWKNDFTVAFAGAVILTLLDVFIEPVAIEFDYWWWKNDMVPLQNYTGWFFLSFCFVLIFRKLHFGKQNVMAPVFLIVQFLFFILLNL